MFSRRNTMIAGAILVATASLGSSCQHDTVAAANCHEVEMLQTDMGKLNVARLPLGRIFLVDFDTKVGVPIADLNPGFPTLPNQDPAATFNTSIEKAIQVTLDAGIKDPDIRVAVTALIKSAAHLDMKNISRTSIPNAVAVFNNDKAARDQVYKRMQQPGGQGPHKVYYLVHSIIFADDLKVALSGTTTDAAQAHVMEYGDFKITITSDCQGKIGISGNPASVFIKLVALAYDDKVTKEFYADTVAPEDLRGVSLTEALK